MIQFRQKEFMGVGAIAAMVAPGMIQSHNQAKKNEEQQEQFQRQNAKLQEKQTEAMNKIAKAAASDPSKAQAFVGQQQQRAYALIPAGLAKKIAQKGQAVFELGRGINNYGKGGNIMKAVGKGLAMGTVFAAGGYAVDKAIQHDRNKITGNAPLPRPVVPPEEAKKKRNKKLIKAATGAALIGGSVLAARRGALGEGFKKLTTGKLTKVGADGTRQAITGKSVLKDLGQTYKAGIKDQVAGTGGLLTAGLLATPAIGYIGERKQLKEQAQAQAQAQQRKYSEDEQQKQPSRAKSVLKKAAIGTLAAAGTFAAARRGAFGNKVARGANDMLMTYGHKISGKNGNKLGDWMMKSGSRGYGKFSAQAQEKALQSAVASGKQATSNLGNQQWLNENISADIAKARGLAKSGQIAEARLAGFDAASVADRAGAARLRRVRSGNVNTTIGSTILNVPASFLGSGSRKTADFLHQVTANTNGAYGQDAVNMAKFLRRHKKTALVGATGLGMVAWKPWTMGENAVKGTLGAIDKNAYAYEKSKEQEVPQE